MRLGCSAALFACIVTACGGTSLPTVIKTLNADTPEELANILVQEDRAIADVCSSMARASLTGTDVADIKSLLVLEQTRNLSALLGALDPAAGEKNACSKAPWDAEAAAGCVRRIQDAYVVAREAPERADVVAGLRAALGDVSALTDKDAGLLAARIQFSVLAVDAYLRLITSIEDEVERLLADVDVPVPFIGGAVSGIVRAAAREVAAEALATGVDNVVSLLEKHHLVHRPAMIRQACDRYLDNPTLGLMAARGLKRIIIAPETAQASFFAKCDLLTLSVGDGERSTRFDFCAALGKDIVPVAEGGRLLEVRVENPGAVPIVGALGSTEIVGKDNRITVAHSLPRTPRSTGSGAGDAAAVRRAALACAKLDAGDEGARSRRCTTASFNLLGSLASQVPDAAPAVDETVANEILARLDNIEQLHAALVANVLQARREMTNLGERIEARFALIDEQLETTVRVESAMLGQITACDERVEHVRAQRKSTLTELDPQLDYESLCREPHATPLMLKVGGAHLRIGRSELCALHQEVHLALWFEGGLFSLGSTRPFQAKVSELERYLPEILRSADALVTGHVDPVGFLDVSTSYESSQGKLMKERADAIVSWREQLRNWPLATWASSSGTVPAQGSCRTAAECDQWRTVSLTFPKLFEAVDPSACPVR